jgi:hypothetical protein
MRAFSSYHPPWHVSILRELLRRTARSQDLIIRRVAEGLAGTGTMPLQ